MRARLRFIHTICTVLLPVFLFSAPGASAFNGADGGRRATRAESAPPQSPLPRQAASAAGAASRPSSPDVELVGHIGGASEAVFLAGNRAYVGEGPRLTILDIANPAAPAVLGKTGLWADRVKDIVVVGDYAYVAAAGLRIVNVADPRAPVETGAFVPADEPVYSLAVAGQYVYATHEYGFWVVDVSNPAAPTQVGGYTLSGGWMQAGTKRIAVIGDYAYFAALISGLQIVNIADPTHPTLTRVVSGVAWSPADVVHAGGYVYVTSGYTSGDGGNALYVLDISDPASPTVLGSAALRDAAALAVADNYAYVTSKNRKDLTIYDVADPAVPVKAGVYAAAGALRDVAVAGGYAYVAAGQNGMEVARVAGLAYPRELGYYYPHGAAQQVLAGAAAGGPFVYALIEKAGIATVDVSTPTAPTETGFYPLSEGQQFIEALLAEDLLYAVLADQSYKHELRIFDVSDPAHLRQIAAYPFDKSPASLALVKGPGASRESGADRSYIYAGGYDLEIVDVSNPTQPARAGFFDLTGYAEDMAAVGDKLYVAAGLASRLAVLDISNPITPLLKGEYTLNGTASLVAAGGQSVYLGERQGETWTLRVLNVADPTTPTLAASLSLAGNPAQMSVAGNILYLAGGESGLRAIDVADPAAPREVGFNDSWPARGMAVVSPRAYVAAGWKGFRVVNSAGLSSPQRAALYAPPGDPRALAISDGTVYLADYASGLKTLDVANPAAPRLVGALSLSGPARDIAVSDARAYVAGSGLTIVDVADPSNPQRIGQTAQTQDAYGVARRGNAVYLASGWGGLRVVDVSNPITPTVVAVHSANDVYDVALGPRYLYASERRDNQSGLQILDTADPLNPAEVAFYAGGWGEVYDIALSSSAASRDAAGVSAPAYAYIAAGRQGLRVLDVTHPLSPTELSAYAEAGVAEDLFVAGGYAYALEAEGLRVLDIADPRLPLEVGAYRRRDADFVAAGHALAGGRAYLAAGAKGLRVVDLSNPRRPQELGAYQPADGAVNRVVMAGSYAALGVRKTSGGNEIQLVDITNAANPRLVGVYASVKVGQPLAALGDLLYAAGTQGDVELYIIDIANPSSPTLAGVYNAGGIYNSPEQMILAGNFAYLTYGTYGMDVLDISNPFQLTRVSRTTSYIFDISLSGNYLYAISRTYDKEGLAVYDVSNPAQLGRVGFHATRNPRGVGVGGGYAFVADYDTGVRVVDVANPAAPVEVGAYTPPETIARVAVSGARVYLYDSNGALRVVNVFNPYAPVEIGRYSLPAAQISVGGEFAGGMAVVGDDIHVAGGTSGYYILRFAGGSGAPSSWLYLPLVTR